MIRVILIERYTLTREGINRLIEEQPDIEVVAMLDDVADAVQHIQPHISDIVLMDLEASGVAGLESIDRLKRIGNTKVVIISTHTSGPIPRSVLSAGADAYLTRSCQPVHLVECLRNVYHGRHYIDPAAHDVLMFPPSPQASIVGKLSSRELSVMIMISQGHSRNTISELLCISPKTVSTYRSRVMRKLGTSTDVDLTHVCYEYGLLDIESRTFRVR